jgi:pimeloyl-ACP methyl ester carboxylesterase
LPKSAILRRLARKRDDESAPRWCRLCMATQTTATAPGPIGFAAGVDGVRLAFRTAGPSGAPAVVLVPGFASHVDELWDPAGPGRFHDSLAQELRVIVYDRRGQGASSGADPSTIDEDVADLSAVLDAAGAERAVVVGQSQGGATAVAFASLAPDRVAGLIVIGGYARPSRGDGYPHGPSRDELTGFADAVAEHWADPGLAAVFAPSAASDPAFLEWWSRSTSKALSREGVRANLLRRASLDVREHAAAVQVRTLVIHRTGDRVTPVEHGRWLAAHIPGAEMLELAGEDHLWWVSDPDTTATSIKRFAKEQAR